MSNNALYMIVTVIFMVGLAVIGILISRGIKDTEDWMVVWMVERSRYASDFFPCMYVLCKKNASE